MSDFVQQHAVKCSFNSSDSWIILSPIEQSIKNKIEAIGKPLKEWDIKIYRGVLTGYNEAFVISTAKRDEILANCSTEDERTRTADLIRPILRGRDIKRYGYTWADLWLINTHNGVKGRIPRIRIEEYPALKAHLDEYWDKISTRADKGETPYNLRNCAYMEDFNQPKITWGEISDRSKFAFDANGKYVPEATTFLMTGGKLPYLLCVLNSPLTEWFFSKVGTTTGVGTVRWKKFTIQELLVPKADQQVLQQYNDLVTAFVSGSLTSTQLSQQANRIIYDMVGLSEDEISYVENFYPPL